MSYVVIYTTDGVLWHYVAHYPLSDEALRRLRADKDAYPEREYEVNVVSTRALHALREAA